MTTEAGLKFSAVTGSACRVFRVDLNDLRDRKTRGGDIVLARRACAKALHDECGMTYEGIAEQLGGTHSAWVQAKQIADRTYDAGMDFRDNYERMLTLAEQFS